jgi:predicted regulator of Ras-like GTPase activity (Roadblock/LC7/MglB family)
LLKQKVNPETESADGVIVTAVSEEANDEDSDFTSLSASLAEIRKLKGIIGYILRSSSSAIIDLENSEKVFQYAILTSEIHESSVVMAKQFSLGVLESALVEGEKIKVLCLSVKDNQISVFMEESANHSSIIRRILL